MQEAFRIARTAVRAPCSVDIPRDIQEAKADLKLLPRDLDVERPPRPRSRVVAKAVQLLKESQKPSSTPRRRGHGERHRGVPRLHQGTQIPTVHTLKGLGTLPYNDPALPGHAGMHGFKQSNLAVQECDLLICIGARFDDRATGVLAKFAPNAKVIHMDVDCSEVGKLRQGRGGDLRATSARAQGALVPAPADRGVARGVPEEQAGLRWKYNAPGRRRLRPAMLKELADEADDKTIITCDVGQHQMWVAQHYGFRARSTI
jgi:acetolactate synthase-1/2/3 large subunit